MFVGLRPKTYILLALSTTVLAVFPHIKLLSPPHTAEMEAELCCHRRANYLTWGSFIQGVYVLHSLSLSLVSWCTVNELRALAQYMAGPFPCGNTVRALYTSRAQGGADKTVHEQWIFGPLSRAAWHDDLDVPASPEREPGQRNSSPPFNTNRITRLCLYIQPTIVYISMRRDCTDEGQ